MENVIVMEVKVGDGNGGRWAMAVNVSGWLATDA